MGRAEGEAPGCSCGCQRDFWDTERSATSGHEMTPPKTRAAHVPDLPGPLTPTLSCSCKGSGVSAAEAQPAAQHGPAGRARGCPESGQKIPTPKAPAAHLAAHPAPRPSQVTSTCVGPVLPGAHLRPAAPGQGVPRVQGGRVHGTGPERGAVRGKSAGGAARTSEDPPCRQPRPRFLPPPPARSRVRPSEHRIPHHFSRGSQPSKLAGVSYEFSPEAGS